MPNTKKMTPQSPPAEEKYFAEHVEDVKGKDAHVQTVYNAALYEAISTSKIDRWSKTSMHLYFAIFIAFCCSCANGYDGSLLTGILSMPYFQSTFHSGITGPKVSLIASLYTVGQMASAPLASILSDRYGRRMTMFIGSLMVIVGMIIAASGSALAQFAVGRLILGGGVTVMNVAAPAYVMEISPPHWRGRCTGLYNVGWFGGAIPAAAVTFGTNNINSDYSWRIPLILQAFACGIVIVTVFTIPESPRYLMANGREEEALDLLIKYHGGGDANSKLVALEIGEFREAISQDGIDKRWWDYRPLFSTHNGRWRMYQVIGMSISGQFSGNGLAYFNTVIYGKLGVTTVSSQLAYNLGFQVLSAAGAFFGALLSDRMPRRKVLTLGTLACSAWLAINSGLQSVIAKDPDNIPKPIAQGALAAYFLFSFNYMFTYTPLQAVIPSEALETTMRAKGLAVSNVICGAMGFLNQFAGPIALQNIGYKYVYFFVAWDAVEAGLWWLFGVEAQGRTLEELEWIYDQPSPVKASLRLDKVVVADDGTVVMTERA